MATETATPVARRGLFALPTGFGSRCNSSKIEVNVKSTSESGIKNLQRGEGERESKKKKKTKAFEWS
jgi:hypothetical protein